MPARMANPALSVPGAFDALQALAIAAGKGGLPRTLTSLVHLRVSQINGCSVCVDVHAQDLKDEGEPDERIWSVGAWRDAPFYTDAERAALALTEAATRLSDRADPVPDEIVDEAARHFGEQELACLILHITVTNAWNRLNVTTRQVPREWWPANVVTWPAQPASEEPAGGGRRSAGGRAPGPRPGRPVRAG